MKKSKNKKSRAAFVDLVPFSSRSADYIWPIPFDKKDRFIPSSVDCAYNSEYYTPEDVAGMLRAL